MVIELGYITTPRNLFIKDLDGIIKVNFSLSEKGILFSNNEGTLKISTDEQKLSSKVSPLIEVGAENLWVEFDKKSERVSIVITDIVDALVIPDGEKVCPQGSLQYVVDLGSKQNIFICKNEDVTQVYLLCED